MEEFLNTTRISQVISETHKAIVSISTTETVEQAFQKLVKHNIHSVPVVDNASQKAVALLDLSDLLSFLVGLFAERFQIKQGQKQQTVDEFAQVAVKAEDIKAVLTAFLQKTASEIANYSNRNQFVSKSQDLTLKEAMVILTDKQAPANRILLVDTQGKVVSILSQSNIIAYMNKHAAELGNKLAHKMNLTIDQAHVGTRPLISFPSELRALDALIMLHEFHLSAVGFLGDDGVTAGNLSLKDLRGLLLDPLALTHSVVDYVNMIRRDSTRDTVPLIHVQTSDPIHRAVGRLSATGVHRLYLFQNSSPVGILSLSDLLEFFLKP